MECGLPAEVEYRYATESSDGPLESARIRWPSGHWFKGLVEFLRCDEHPGATAIGEPDTRDDTALPKPGNPPAR
jgi:hypothetical protein